ncbi:hypothetical protein [Tenacibaculum halocynthiae]|uniref:hypothetical protein n=1 Tax=Tenacibaculum halocynthiae TaxID=1254437 RepID=UPI003D64BC41
MHNRLFLLCPTDCLESTINNEFRCKNYFYTSLGNSFVANNKTIEYLKQTICKHNIKEISFILSSNNDIINDALGTQDFSKIRGLKRLYDQIIQQKKHTEVLWKNTDSQFSILSYFLNYKIKELQLELGSIINSKLKINGKIYNRFENVFENIHPNLICIEKHYLN